VQLVRDCSGCWHLNEGFNPRTLCTRGLVDPSVSRSNTMMADGLDGLANEMAKATVNKSEKDYQCTPHLGAYKG
jgi:hypothetical protein